MKGHFCLQILYTKIHFSCLNHYCCIISLVFLVHTTFENLKIPPKMFNILWTACTYSVISVKPKHGQQHVSIMTVIEPFKYSMSFT